MTSQAERSQPIKGGGFLIEDAAPEEIFTPEDINEEQRMFARTAEEFLRKEVIPREDEIYAKNWETHRELMRKAGELGLLSIDIPEKYGGLGLNKVSSRDRRRAVRSSGVVRRDAKLARQHRHAPHSLFRHRRAEEKISAPARHGRDDRRIRVDRAALGLGRARRKDEGRAFGRRDALHFKRPEDVDHQRQLRRPVHGLRQS